jgi:hypothetical protein
MDMGMNRLGITPEKRGRMIHVVCNWNGSLDLLD